jgi:hypothetical protein
MVFVKYCSSDSWFGDAPASTSTFGFAFRGSRIVTATIAAMVANNGLGASGGQERLLFGGCSAGGRGVLTNLDAVAAAAPANVQVSGMLDAAAWVDVQPIIPNMLTLQEMTQDLYGFTSPPIPANCAAQYAGADAWMCLWPSTRLQFIQTPYFLNAAQVRSRLAHICTQNNKLTHPSFSHLCPLPLPFVVKKVRCVPDHVRHEQPGLDVLLQHAG